MNTRSSWKNLFLVVGLAVYLPSLAEAKPRLYGDIRAAECLDAFHLANWAFNSRASQLYATERIPTDMGSEMVLGALYGDISGGGALEGNEDVFEKLPHQMRNLYWEKAADRAHRIVVQEDAMGWRGDRYSLYVLPSSAEKSDFSSEDGKDYQMKGIPALLEESWRPPLVLRRNGTNKLWFISMGEPYQILADWGVYLHTPDGYRQECKVVFRNTGEGEITALPNSVQRLVGLLGETLGPGQGEGTLQPTARIRLDVQRVWTNAAIRPWALTDRDRYNSKDEVDAGLEAWSQHGRSYKEVYRKIRSIYPVAEKDLADYYQRTFKLSRRGSAALAKWALEIGYCAHYSFSNGGDYFRYNDVDNNPWSSVQTK